MTDPYLRHRDLLFTVAYEILGSAADAEDVVQEVWLRWREVDQASVRDPRAYLVRIVTRLSLNQLRALSRRRESYVGPWLPEPLVTTADVADDAELADAVSLAMLVLLDSLGPMERAVFVLREVFGYGYDEIAEAVQRSPVAVRQVASRARRHLHERRPAMVDDTAGPTPRDLDRGAQVVSRFHAAAQGQGELQDLLDLLSPDVVLLTDGGGVVKAALQPIRGVEKVLRFLTGVRPEGADVLIEVADLNGGPGLVIRESGHITAAVSALVEDGLVTELYVVRNPAKLTRVAAGPVALAR